MPKIELAPLPEEHWPEYEEETPEIKEPVAKKLNGKDDIYALGDFYRDDLKWMIDVGSGKIKPIRTPWGS
jgi:hypothetical protein